MTTAKTANAPSNLADLPVRLDQAWRVLGVNQEIIRSADQKAYFLSFISAILATYMLNNFERIVHIGVLQGVLLFMFLIASAGFFFYALRTLSARAEVLPKGAETRGIIFFGDISSYHSANDYVAATRSTSLIELLDDLIKQSHHISRIAQHKYTAYRRAWLCLVIEVTIFMLLELSVAVMTRGSLIWR